METHADSIKLAPGLLKAPMTEAEEKLWFRIARKQICGLEFFRKKQILTYLVDFYCPAAKLIIELNSQQRYTSVHREQEMAKDQTLMGMGFSILHLDNRKVLTETDAVLASIEARVMACIQSGE